MALAVGENVTAYDFLDLGCSHGRSITFGIERLGGTRGLGIDVDPTKVDSARKKGFDAIVADASCLSPDRFKGIRFAIMSHFLEHLSSIDLAQKIMTSASQITSEFIFIRQPYFEADGYLLRKGLKLYWSDWTGHLNKMSSLDFYRICEALRRSGLIERFCIYRQYPILDSTHKAIVNLDSGQDRHDWIEGKDSLKEFFDFPKGAVFSELGCVLSKAPDFIPQIQAIMRSSDVVFDSAKVL